jgi:tryptophan-rich sensory protein
MKDIKMLVLFVLACELAGIIGSFFTMPSIPTWYASLQKPFFNPPSWVFAPVWLSLYLLMGIAAYLVWSNGKKKEARGALGLFAFQLALNVLWSFAFFGLHSTFSGLLVIVALWLCIAATMVAFWRISKASGWLLVPYILWVSFATLLNLSVFLLNPS